MALGLLTIIATFAELISISAAFPFIATLAAPERLFEIELFAPLISWMGVTSPNGLLLPFSIAFGSAILLSTMLRLSLIWTQTRLSHLIGIDIANDIFRRTLHQPYRVHAARNTAQVIAAVNSKSGRMVTAFVLPTLTLLSSLVLVGTILVALTAFLPGAALTILLTLSLIYGGVAMTLRRHIQRNGDVMAAAMSRTVQTLQEGLGGIRDVLLDGSQEIHVRKFGTSVREERLALSNNY